MQIDDWNYKGSLLLVIIAWNIWNYIIIYNLLVLDLEYLKSYICVQIIYIKNSWLQFVFHFLLTSLAKVQTHLFFSQLQFNSGTYWTL